MEYYDVIGATTIEAALQALCAKQANLCIDWGLVMIDYMISA